MVSTPDVAKDLFSGLWDPNTDLHQAYQSLSTTTSGKFDNFQPTITYLESRPSSRPSSSCSMQGAQTSYIPVTTSYIPVTCAPSTSYIPAASTAQSASYIPASTAPSASYISSASSAPAYIPAACPTPPTSYNIPTSRAPSYSPLSCGSSSCSESSKTESFDSSSSFTGGPGPSSTRECTKLALILLSQSNKKLLSREEEEKRRIRRERNKIAATKCRQKRRAHSTNVGTEYNEVCAKQRELEDQIGALQREKEELKQLLETHYCHKPAAPPYTTHPSIAPPTSFSDLFVKQEPATPALKQELDPFN